MPSRILVFVCLLLLLAGVASAQYAPFNNPHQQFFDNNGHPLAGGRISTYTAGTLNPLQTYRDINGTPNTNPIVLDSGGFATIYLANGLIYKFVASSSTGIQQWTQDNIASALTSTAVLANFASPPPVGNVTPNTGQFTNINSTVMVTCPSCTDWGAAINAAIATCQTGYGGYRSCKVVLPEVNSGPWTTSVTIADVNVSLVGQGKTASTFSCTVAGDCLRVSPSTFTVQPGSEISSFSIIGNGASGQNILHVRDTIARNFRELFLDGANEPGGACVWLEAYRKWTERNRIDIDTGTSCTKSWRFSADVGNPYCPSSAACSLGYNWIYAHMNPNTSAQIGMSWEGNIYFYNGELHVVVNKDGTVCGASVFQATGNATVNGEAAFIDGEDNCGSTSGYLWNLAATSTMEFTGGYVNFNPSTPNNILTNNFWLPLTGQNGYMNPYGTPALGIGLSLNQFKVGSNLILSGATNPSIQFDSRFLLHNSSTDAWLFSTASGNAMTIGTDGTVSALNNFSATNSLLGQNVQVTGYVKTQFLFGTTANPATYGFVRMAKTDQLVWRNNANSADLGLGINGSDQLTFSGTGSFGSIIIGGTNTAPVVATPTVGQAACIYAAGPPVQIGKCTTVVSSGGACTCAP